MDKKTILLGLLLIFGVPSIWAQSSSIQGNISNDFDHEPMLGVSIQVYNTKDSNAQWSTASDFDGSFKIEKIPYGSYRLSAQYLGFTTFQKSIIVSNKPLNLGNIGLKRSEKSLNTVVVAGTQVRAEQNGDTTAFNANAFKTNPDATAEDLLNKMPGISSAGGTLKVNGEEVKKVLVDGKPFFGDDPNAAIKNLPSEIIDKIQVYDKASDQSQFTGFDDGNSEKTVNILTKKGRNNGVFGKVNAGYGLDEKSKDGRYSSGGSINFFNGDRRISLVGLANNINQQNFSSDDLLGVASSSGSSRGRGRGSNSVDNFLVSQQGGITQTQSTGVNYSDAWGSKLKVSGSYFFNRASNNTSSDLSRNYILQQEDSSLLYQEQSVDQSVNMNHRAALRTEWTIDSNNAFIIQPSFSYQQNNATKELNGNNIYNDVINGSSLANKTSNDNKGYTFSNVLLYRHKFAKKGRTLSANIDTKLNQKSGTGSQYSLNDYIDSSSTTDQINQTKNNGSTIGASINYTEPISKKMQLQFRYNPSINHNESNKTTYANNGTGLYDDLDSNLSNQFTSDYMYQKGGVGLRFSGQKLNFNMSLNGQYAILNGLQEFPQSLTVARSFRNVLPMAMMNYKFSRTENIRIFYRTNTDAPSISQLQNIVDNSNPLQLKVGNPLLVQDFSHSLNIHYARTSQGKGNGLFVFANATLTNNYIGNSTQIQNDGVQISMPVNLNGMLRSNAFLNYSFPLSKLKSNLNLSSNLAYTSTPSIINNITNKSNNYTLGAGAVIGSNISENIDFTIALNGTYNIANNTAQAQSNFNYYTQSASVKLNWIFLKHFVFNSDLNHTLYRGLGEGYDRDYILWNASLGYKFLKSRALQADIYAFDILNQNNSISRSINDYYIEDNRTTVLQRFFMLRLTYTFRSFKGTTKMPELEDKDHDGPPHDFRGGPPPGAPTGPPPF